MQKCRDQLHLHALAERQLAYRLARQLFDAEHLGQLAERALELVRGERIDFAMKLKAVGRGQVPPELVLLAHDEGETPAKGILALPGDVAEHLGPARGRIDEPGE